MKKILVLSVVFLVVSLFADAKTQSKKVDKKNFVCLTVQAENGSIKQKINKDGSITCIIKPNDVIRVSTILLNGEDITNQLEKNKFNLPLITENSTLEITFDQQPYFTEQAYRTIAMY